MVEGRGLWLRVGIVVEGWVTVVKGRGLWFRVGGCVCGLGDVVRRVGLRERFRSEDRVTGLWLGAWDGLGSS